MATIQISSQPAEANAGKTLNPGLTLQQQLEPEPILYFAHAVLLDTAGNEVSGVLQGNKSATGMSAGGGLRYTFADLTITTPGQYYILVNIFRSANGATLLGNAKSNMITVV
ncbi:hypothetical protein BBK36DRAFT_1141003 [Trichoderma citrinoviride]|uniref:Velvet domain-containing protein n=1 Tax=Trichoderma citrinoviride TaxID=58853 RepID=A0A2T4BA78_9HYPO|nr:hypothetical protein BBK36DRAFT_1141003 [Trichoderma citrinoviride]PTB66131.1 hypothetical protein BBK36DRAFT_1141003 [Trichoderma citrinoviride]